VIGHPCSAIFFQAQAHFLSFRTGMTRRGIVAKNLTLDQSSWVGFFVAVALVRTDRSSE